MDRSEVVLTVTWPSGDRAEVRVPEQSVRRITMAHETVALDRKPDGGWRLAVTSSLVKPAPATEAEG